MFELITGRPLFCVPGSDHEDDNHILSLIAAIGPLPDNLFNQWQTSSFYFTPDGKLFNCKLGGIAEGEQPLLLEHASMETLFDRANPELGEEEAVEIKALIRRILQYDTKKRPTAVEILADPWFRRIV
jgi:non-specific serine/threonine protein kinase